MVVVYLKNGEKAPMPDANYVKIEAAGDATNARVLRCYFGDIEVGYFQWDQVAGYTVSPVRVPSLGSNDAWAARLESMST